MDTAVLIMASEPEEDTEPIAAFTAGRNLPYLQGTYYEVLYIEGLSYSFKVLERWEQLGIPETDIASKRINPDIHLVPTFYAVVTFHSSDTAMYHMSRLNTHPYWGQKIKVRNVGMWLKDIMEMEEKLVFLEPLCSFETVVVASSSNPQTLTRERLESLVSMFRPFGRNARIEFSGWSKDTPMPSIYVEFFNLSEALACELLLNGTQSKDDDATFSVNISKPRLFCYEYLKHRLDFHIVNKRKRPFLDSLTAMYKFLPSVQYDFSRFLLVTDVRKDVSPKELIQALGAMKDNMCNGAVRKSPGSKEYDTALVEFTASEFAAGAAEILNERLTLGRKSRATVVNVELFELGRIEIGLKLRDNSYVQDTDLIISDVGPESSNMENTKRQSAIRAMCSQFGTIKEFELLPLHRLAKRPAFKVTYAFMSEAYAALLALDRKEVLINDSHYRAIMNKKLVPVTWEMKRRLEELCADMTTHHV